MPLNFVLSNFSTGISKSVPIILLSVTFTSKLSITGLPIKLGNGGELSEVIDDVELIGRERVLKFTHAGTNQRALIDLEQEVKPGDSVKFKMNLDRVYLFKPDGERIY